MRKVVYFNLITLDGFIARPNGDIGWHNVDDEFDEFAVRQTGEASGLIFGRVTYQLMESFWPTPAAIAEDPIVAGHMNSLPKFCFSRTLERVEWNNSRLMKGDAPVELVRLKQEPGGDLFIFGSAKLASAFIEHGLIDEYRLLLNPVVLGSGIPCFQNVQATLNLKLLSTRNFLNGNVLLTYQPA